MFEGDTCDEWRKPDHCVFMLNEGQGERTLADSMKTKNFDWLNNYYTYLSPDGIYHECAMAEVIREAILQELKLRQQ